MSTFPTPETAPATWAEWNEQGLWPDWMPADWRQHIERFWGADHGRKPAEWLRDHVRQSYGRAPIPLGEERVCADRSWRRGPVRGRYVHTWNNMCVLVGNDGVGRVSSTGGLLTIDDFEALELARCM